jgi:hypothetical protein
MDRPEKFTIKSVFGMIKKRPGMVRDGAEAESLGASRKNFKDKKEKTRTGTVQTHISIHITMGKIFKTKIGI